MKDWEVLKCDNCGAPMKPSGRSAMCLFCGTVYTKSGDVPPLRMEYTADEFALNGAPCMTACGWIPMVDVNPLAFGEAPPMSGEEGWIDSYGNRYGAFDV